ncbi:hypothetical protein FB451DRAFT_1167505 [Mycena latifolia]|nr:hypothetical protein FB451DRAFT_1167505 [Mycena latifolia]
MGVDTGDGGPHTLQIRRYRVSQRHRRTSLGEPSQIPIIFFAPERGDMAGKSPIAIITHESVRSYSCKTGRSMRRSGDKQEEHGEREGGQDASFFQGYGRLHARRISCPGQSSGAALTWSVGVHCNPGAGSKRTGRKKKTKELEKEMCQNEGPAGLVLSGSRAQAQARLKVGPKQGSGPGLEICRAPDPGLGLGSLCANMWRVKEVKRKIPEC